jgi:hypothetical protein
MEMICGLWRETKGLGDKKVGGAVAKSAGLLQEEKERKKDDKVGRNGS